MLTLKNLCDYYFQCFSEQDIEKLSELFSDDIKLEDWNISVQGKDSVLDAVGDIFKHVKTIIVTPIHKYEDYSTVCCEILILVDDIETLRVVDIIKFNSLMKIDSIRAYKL